MGKQIRCPVCRESFSLDSDLTIGDTFNCPDCSAELKLTALDPTEVEEVLDSWDDYWNGDDEEEE